MKKHTIRCADGGTKTLENYVSRSKAIKLMCTECLGWESHPKTCTDVNCPLYPFRGQTRIAYSSKKTEDDDKED